MSASFAGAGGGGGSRVPRRLRLEGVDELVREIADLGRRVAVLEEQQLGVPAADLLARGLGLNQKCRSRRRTWFRRRRHSPLVGPRFVRVYEDVAHNVDDVHPDEAAVLTDRGGGRDHPTVDGRQLQVFVVLNANPATGEAADRAVLPDATAGEEVVELARVDRVSISLFVGGQASC